MVVLVLMVVLVVRVRTSRDILDSNLCNAVIVILQVNQSPTRAIRPPDVWDGQSHVKSAAFLSACDHT